MSTLVAALDLGTTWIKAGLFAHDGSPLGLARVAAPPPHDQTGHFDADAYCSAALTALATVVSNRAWEAGSVSALALSSQRASMVVTDDTGQPVTPAVSWQATVTRAGLDAVLTSIGEVAFTRATGLPVLPLLPIFRLADPETRWARAVAHGGMLLSMGDFVLRRLGAPPVTDPSLAGATGLFDSSLLTWDQVLLELTGLSMSGLPELLPTGQVVGALNNGSARATGLLQGIPLVMAGADQQCALLGSGMKRPGDTLINLGTSATVQVPMVRFLPPEGGSIVLPHVLPGQWVMERFIGYFGAVLHEKSRKLGFDSVDAMIHAGVECPIPHDLPRWNRGSAISLTQLIEEPSIAAALLLEALSGEVSDAVHALAGRVPAGSLHISGGGTQSREFVEYLSAALHRPLTLLASREATLTGAACFALAAAGLTPSVTSASLSAASRNTVVTNVLQGSTRRWRDSCQRAGRCISTQSGAPAVRQTIHAPSEEELAHIRTEAMTIAKVGMYRYRMDGTIVYLDAGILRLLDIADSVTDPSELCGRNLSELMQYIEKPHSLRGLAVKHGVVMDMEYHFRTLSGKDRWVYHNAYLVENEQTGEKEILVLARDITDLKRNALALEASEQRWRTLVEHSQQGFVVCAHTPPRMILINHAMLDMLGVPEAVLLDRDLQELVNRFDREDQDAAAARLAATPARDPAPERRELRLENDRGQTVWVELRSTEIEYGGLTAVQTTVMDVTSRVEELQKRMEIEAKLNDAQRLESLGVLAGGIAHDFNNLLGAIMGNTEFLREEVAHSPEMMDFVEEIAHAAGRGADLCRQLLAYSGRKILAKAPLDINQLVMDTSRLFDISVSRRVELVQNLTPDLPAILAETSQMRQVVMNLVTNASESIGDNPGRITLRTDVVDLGPGELARFVMGDSLSPGRHILIEVEDTGCGMPEEVRKRIFEPFFTTKFTGRGLGLAAVRGIVRSHGGAFDVESRLGSGTRIRVLFPVSPEPVVTRADPSPAVSSWRGSGTVLLADDEASPRKVTAKLIRSLGFECETAENGEEAVSLFMSAPDHFDAVVLDVVMPVCDGPRCLERIRAKRPVLPALFISGFDDEALRESHLDESTGFLQKPFLLKDLREMLRRLLTAGRT